MMFERNSLEQILDSMIGWAKGVTSKLTDFRIGSRIRTLYEAVGVIIEEFEDRVYRAMRIQIPANIYAIFDFERFPAVYASGVYTFQRPTPADKDYPIPAGTLMSAPATATTASIGFRSVKDVVLLTGTTSIDANIICLTPGTIGNVPANSITSIPYLPQGVASGTNATGFMTGAEEETPDAQKSRFQKFIEAQSRGILQSVKYGASLAIVTDVSGIITERVLASVAVEDLPARRGEVDVYLWNGVGTVSSDLIAAVTKLLFGYYTPDGRAVYGYKPAGVIPNIYSASKKSVIIKLVITPEVYTTVDALKPAIEAALDDFFSRLGIGDTLYQTGAETAVKNIDGVMDVKLYLSPNTDPPVWVETNTVPAEFEIVSLVKPITY